MIENYNPDVLTCLANLSSDEVFTPPNIANQMLDLLPAEIWRDKNATFLDPAAKSGVFLREIAKRLMEGLKDEIPDQQKRIDHIFTEQIFGIAITDMTALLTRRSLYCSKKANGKYSICEGFDTPDGNIMFGRVIHEWEGDQCKYCGANLKTYDRDESLETHAYQFIHTDTPEELFNMKFDVIIGNPPYQLSTGGGTDDKKSATQAKPIYNKFIEQAKKLTPRFISMIIPARWYSGGMGLNQFRSDMLNDKRIVKLVDYINSKDCFQGVDIAGGVCYFLWDRDHSSNECEVVNFSGDYVNSATRPLNEFTTLFVRSNDAIKIIDKITKQSSHFMDEIVSPIDTFGIPSKEKGHKKKQPGDITLVHSVGYNDQGESYISKDSIKKNRQFIDKYKVKISIMVPQGGEVGIKPENGYRSISTPQILTPGQVDTFSYLNIGFFDTKKEAENLVSYVNCKFTRYLIRTTYSSVHVSKDNFKFVPLVDLKRSWTDKALYSHFRLTDDEVNIIEKTMRPMKAVGGEDDGE